MWLCVCCEWNYDSLVECKQPTIHCESFADVWRPETTVHELSKSPSSLMHNQITFLVVQHDNVSKTFICVVRYWWALFFQVSPCPPCSVAASGRICRLIRFDLIFRCVALIDMASTLYIQSTSPKLASWKYTTERRKENETVKRTLPRNRREKLAR